jgi:hypothetical protein
MRLREPGSVDHAIEALTIVMNQLYDCRSGTALEVLENWLRWWEIADAQLRSLFTDIAIAMTDLSCCEPRTTMLVPVAHPAAYACPLRACQDGSTQ